MAMTAIPGAWSFGTLACWVPNIIQSLVALYAVKRAHEMRCTSKTGKQGNGDGKGLMSCVSHRGRPRGQISRVAADIIHARRNACTGVEASSEDASW